MPCYDPRDGEENSNKTMWLCAILTKIEKGEPVEIQKLPKAGTLRDWWESHKRWDMDRLHGGQKGTK